MIPLFKVHMPRSVLRPLTRTLFSGFIGEGPQVKEFERLIADFIGNPLVLTTNNCTSSIQLALRLSNVCHGDEVISTPMTCTATNEPVLAAGGKIVWADVEPNTGNISAESIKQKITGKTKAIIVVHWGGYPVDLEPIIRIARPKGIKVIEDAAHAFGSEYRGRKIGCHADFVCFSFQAIKHITTVDGGALLCRSKKDYHRGKLLRWYGINRETNRKDFRCEEDIPEWGYKFHMNDVAATLGIEQMKYIDRLLAQRRLQALRYRKELSGIPGLTIPQYRPDRNSAFWLFTIFVEEPDRFIETMKQKRIMVSKVHARNDTHTMFKQFKTRLPGVDLFYRRCMCIPIGYWINRENQDYIIKAISKGWM